MSKFYLIFVIVFSISFAQAGLLDDFFDILTNPRKLTAQDQCDLGRMYLINDRQEKAQRLFKKAAKRGNADAQYQLAKMLERQGNYEEAFDLYRQSAEQGNKRAKFHVARMYDHGTGVKQDRRKATDLYHELHLLYKNSFEELEDLGFSIGDSEAQYDLSDSYPELNIDNTNIRAFLRDLGDLHSLAQKGDPEAQYQISRAYSIPYLGDRARYHPTSLMSIVMDQERAIYWEKKAAEQGHAIAQRHLGTRYYRGSRGVAEDVNEAIKWYTSAARQGDMEAQRLLYHVYNGTYEHREAETLKDKKLAYAWVRVTLNSNLTYKTHEKEDESKKNSVHRRGRQRKKFMQKDILKRQEDRLIDSITEESYQKHLEQQRDRLTNSMTSTELAEAEELYQKLSQDIRVANSN